MGIGAFTGGIMSAGILFYNGYIIGKLVQYLIVNHETQQLFTGLLPHAFIEVLGLILFSIVSSYPFIYLYRFIKGETIELKKLILTVLQLIFAAAVLLFIASLLEQYVSHVHLP
ncbi:stage II sporulation protein M [Bacillus safensis]|uniref:stage II sporulation protein M n=1 Tax=Bacillus safensis TaxID=561879 RepID=UPI003F5AD998